RTPADSVVSSSGLPVSERRLNVFTYTEFIETYVDLESMCCENPLVGYYNVRFLF
ncbi:hypothetical protein BC827DRAFT_1146505, partial [Russula dissimulans]